MSVRVCRRRWLLPRKTFAQYCCERAHSHKSNKAERSSNYRTREIGRAQSTLGVPKRNALGMCIWIAVDHRRHGPYPTIVSPITTTAPNG